MEIILRQLGLHQDVIDLISYDDIQTQIREEGVGRPDIVIDNTDVTIFVEVKTRRERALEENQRRAYPDHLLRSSKKYRHLIFLVPSGHPEEQDLLEICDDYNQRANTGDRSLLWMVSWDDLLNGIAAAEIHNDSSLISEVLSFISEHVRHRGIEIEFTGMEIALMNNYTDLRIAANLIFGFQHFIHTVSSQLDQRLKDELGTKYVAIQNPVRERDVQANQYDIGVYLDKENLYVGMSFHDEEHAKYALSIGFYPQKFKIEDDDVYFDGECYYKSIDDKYVLAANDAARFVDAVVKTVVPYYQDKFLLSTSS